jgi:hypothetical protein
LTAFWAEAALLWLSINGWCRIKTRGCHAFFAAPICATAEKSGKREWPANAVPFAGAECQKMRFSIGVCRDFLTSSNRTRGMQTWAEKSRYAESWKPLWTWAWVPFVKEKKVK